MKQKLEGKAVSRAHKLINQLAEIQLIAEAGHFDTLRTILRYVGAQYPKEPKIKYCTAQSWLNLEKNKILMKKYESK